MLSSDDAALAERNPAIPGLPVLLDPEAFLELLRPHLPELEGPLEPFYLRYKPGTGALAGYVGSQLGEPMRMYARAYRLGDLPKLRDDERTGHRRSAIVLTERNMVARLFPQDLELRVLERFADVHSCREMLRGLLPNRPELWDATLRCLRYKPERRYVGALMAGSLPAATLRIFSAHEYHDVLYGPKWLRSREVLTVPKRLGRRSRYCTLAYEWLDGRPLLDVLETEAAETAVQSVGAAVAELHAQRSYGRRVFTPGETAGRLIKLAESIADLCPAVEGRVHRLANQIAQRVMETMPIERTIHADLHAGQVLLVGGGVALIDLDQVAIGDPAVDLGNFLAHLHYTSMASGQEDAHVPRIAKTLCDGYDVDAKTRLPRRRVNLYTAVGLLNIAPHFFRSRDADWGHKIEQALSLVEEELQAHDATAQVSVVLPSKQDQPNGAPALISDPFGLRENPQMAFIARAFDESEIRRKLAPLLRSQHDIRPPLRIEAIRAVRYKTGSRCLIEYDVAGASPDGERRSTTIIGKARARGSVQTTFQLMQQLVQNGFDDESEDRVSVPSVVGTIASWRMWLQRKIQGTSTTTLLPGPEGVELARRIAAALAKLHAAKVRPRRQHTMEDELSILSDRLAEVAQSYPVWRDRLSRILDACCQLGRALNRPQRSPIHRDFYPDHVLLSGERLYLIDFDLYCEGDPALDLGNFCGHLIEQALRSLGSPDALADCETALVERYQELTGVAIRPAVEAYTTLTLARHIAVSNRIPGRRQWTGALIDMCEQRIGLNRQNR